MIKLSVSILFNSAKTYRKQTFYRDYKCILVTDNLKQYHLPDKKLTGVTNTNCRVHTRPGFADAIKALDKSNPDAVKQS